jgi:ABC-type multidrug transport system ATPase subunit
MRVELRGVSKRFGRVIALQEIDLTIERGAKVALIGPNGSGKSTLTRALIGLIRCTGEIRLDGHPIDSRGALRRRLAYVPQLAPQLGASVGELSELVLRTRGLARDQLVGPAAALELDLDRLRSQPFRTLSGGMKQKLLIALALAARPTLLVLDEPTASLDPASRQRFFGLVGEHAAEATVILCSHRIDEVQHLVDQVVELREGRVIYHGPAARFLGQRALSSIELRVPHANGASRWLREQGFHQALSGWWVRQATRDEKMALLPRLSAELGEALTNVVVRDLEAVDPEAVGSKGERP